MQRRNNKKGPVQNVLDFLQRNWLVLLGCIVAYPLVVRLMRMAEAKDKVAEADAQTKEQEALNKIPSAQRQALNEITSNTGYHVAAKSIFDDTGFAYDWYDPRRWSENDKAVFDAIDKSPCGINIDDTLIDCYALISGNRHLFNDLKQVLDEDYFNQLNW